jgi:hypothetical protein
VVHGFHRSRPDWGGDVLDRPCQLEDLAGEEVVEAGWAAALRGEGRGGVGERDRGWLDLSYATGLGGYPRVIACRPLRG